MAHQQIVFFFGHNLRIQLQGKEPKITVLEESVQPEGKSRTHQQIITCLEIKEFT